MHNNYSNENLPLLRLQADETGQRLKDLNFKYTRLVCSTLIRATETADIIAKYLPNVPRETCSMLVEGSPVVPDPGSSNWRPERKVSAGAFCCLNLVHVCCQQPCSGSSGKWTPLGCKVSVYNWS